MQISGTTALVTGAGRRIGRALALSLGESGADVVVHYNTSEDAALETVDTLRDMGVNAEAVGADLSDADGCAFLWSESLRLMRDVPRIVINNASFYGRFSFSDTDSDIWDVAMNVNVRAPFLLAKSLASSLSDGVPGKVININDSRRVYRSRFAYGISNAALSGLTRSLSVMLAPDIQVNEVLLGPTLPPVDAKESDVDTTGDVRDRFAMYGPSGRMGSLSDVCDAVKFLISNDHISGASLSVDGGLSARW